MGSRLRSEQGASAVIVAVSLLLLFGAGAIAVDLGSAWQTKRDLVIDTDAAATAAGRRAADEGCTPAAKAAAEAFLEENLDDPSAPPVSLTAAQYQCALRSASAPANTIRVAFHQLSDSTFSGAVGQGEIDVVGSSTVQFNGVPSGLLRPIAACDTDQDIHGTKLQDAPVLGGPPADNEPVVYYLSMVRTWQNPDCGGAAGDWGWLCFDSNCGAGNPLDGVKAMLTSGYSGHVTLGAADTSGDEDCKPAGGPQDCETKNGTSGQSYTSQLDSLVTSGETFPLLVVDNYTSNDGGQAHPVAFAYVRLDGYCYTHGGSNKVAGSFEQLECDAQVAAEATAGQSSLIFKFALFGIQKSNSPRDFVNFAPARVQICGVDGDDENRCLGLD